MLSKKAKKGIIFGFLGGVVGFFVALFLFTLSCALEFKAGWTGRLTITPAAMILVGFIITSLILIILTISKVKSRTKLVGFLFAITIFLITYLISLRGNIYYHPPYPSSNQLFSILGIGAIVSLLVLILFIILGVKKGLSIANKEK